MRDSFLSLAGSATLKRTVSRYGMRGPQSFARWFIVGENIDQALEADGFTHTLNYLDEHVGSADAARAAAAEYLTIIDTIDVAGLPCKSCR